MKILLIEDDTLLAKTLVHCFEKEGISADTCSEGDVGLFIAQNKKYDLILLDNFLPKKLGTEISRELRKSNTHTPILFMSAWGSFGHIQEYVNAGANSFIAKPFSMNELMMKVRALTLQDSVYAGFGYRIRSEVLMMA